MATKKKENPNTFAVIELSGKQYLVKAGDKIVAEKIDAKAGDSLSIKEVLLVNDGEKTKVGTPFVEGATVALTFDKEGLGEKVEIKKYKAKSRYRRATGHRQVQSHLTVTLINQ